jgi:pimeloyl-ACP methyl ester carboxylesterase
MEDFSQLCAEGTVVQDRMISLNNGISLRVITFLPPVDRGNPAIVMVAGWITQMTAWKSVLKEMTRDFIVVYIETREKSSSRIPPNTGQSISAIGEDIAALTSKLHFRENRFVLFGSSLGATVIAECYHSLEKKPLALILISPNAVFRVPLIWKLIVRNFYPPLYALIKPSVKWYLKNFRLNVKIDAEQFNKYCAALDSADPWKLKKAVLAVSDYEIWNRLGSLDCPVLLIGASKDVLHEPGIFQTIASKIPHAEVVDLGTNAETHSARVVDELRKFLFQAGSGKMTPPV